ncbi:MAG TPA: hypothetical protein VNO14_17330 [Blastocatellia bacterium]|nr:hypothetical protein [Blastocatellia bacterium]
MTITNGAAALIGTGTKFTRDLKAGDVLTISGTRVTVASVTNDTTAALTAIWAGSSGSVITAKSSSGRSAWPRANRSGAGIRPIRQTSRSSG